jgi:glycosyltransferase involved in cell wall biosynthesis
VITEALGHSLPVVATAVGNIPEQLDDGRRGVLVPQQDPAGLASGIERIIDDHSFRQRCIREGYNYAREHGLDAFVAHVARKVRDMIEERQRRTAR